ncbi:MAG: alpha/beta hydrolase [Rhodoferax sp.]
MSTLGCAPNIPATWVLLRGLTRESGHWGDFVERWQAAWPQARVITLDAPGAGPWYAQRSPTRVEDWVAHWRAQLAQQQVSGPLRLLALSMGGMAALSWAHTDPRAIEAMVLINTSDRSVNPFYWRLQPSAYARLLRLFLPGQTPAQRERQIWQLTTRLRGPEVLAQWTALAQAHPVSKANAMRQLWAAARYRTRAAVPPVPTLLLASTHDALVDVRCSRALAQHWGWPLREHGQAGHDLPLDDPDWVLRQVQQWISEQKIGV